MDRIYLTANHNGKEKSLELGMMPHCIRRFSKIKALSICQSCMRESTVFFPFIQWNDKNDNRNKLITKDMVAMETRRRYHMGCSPQGWRFSPAIQEEMFNEPPKDKPEESLTDNQQDDGSWPEPF